MTRFYRWVLLFIVLTSLAAGLMSRLPDTENSRILSAQDFPTPAPFPARKPNVTDPIVRAKYAVLLDAESFYPLYKKEAFTPVPVASTVKMMTAVVAVRHYQQDEVVTVSKKAAGQIGSDSGLLSGEKITIKNLLYALLIESGNDAAYALAEHSGSVEKFVGWMNEETQRLGMRSTKFVDPSGLDDSGFSTAFDLAILASAIIRDPFLISITGMAEATVKSIDGREHQLKNSNRLVTTELNFPGAIGIKTGYTPVAGHVLVSAAERNNKKLVGVILFTHDDTKEASALESAKLLSWGYDNHEWISN